MKKPKINFLIPLLVLILIWSWSGWSAGLLKTAQGLQQVLGEDEAENLQTSFWGLLTAKIGQRLADNLNAPLALAEFPLELIAADWEATEKDWGRELEAWAEPEGLDLGELSGQVLVGIYYTHTGETYNLTDGKDRIDKGAGGVVKVGTVLAEALEKQGIKTINETRLNDLVYNDAYNQSYQTAVNMLAENPEIRILLDLHRDSAKSRQRSIVEIEGQKMATILFVVGSDARAAFPNWQKNRDFAQKAADRLNAKYPGLCSGVTVQEGRYNQFLHPQAMLVEMGNTNNTLEEAKASGAALAEVLAELLVELLQEENQS